MASCDGYSHGGRRISFSGACSLRGEEVLVTIQGPWTCNGFLTACLAAERRWAGGKETGRAWFPL